MIFIINSLNFIKKLLTSCVFSGKISLSVDIHINIQTNENFSKECFNMKKLVSIALSLILMTTLFATYTSAVRLNDDENGFVALQVLEDECELVDNSETNDKAFNQPVKFLASHGIGTVSQGDSVMFPNVEIKEHANMIFLKVGYNLREGYETTNCEYSIYLDKIDGEPVGIIECFQYETPNSDIKDQIYKYAACDVEPGTYNVYVVLTNEYSGSFSEVGFIYDDGEFDENWKENPAATAYSIEEGSQADAEPRVPYTYTGENIYYISDNGDDMNDGLTPETAIKSMTKATLLFGDVTDGTLVIVDTHTYERPIPACNLVGADNYAKFQTTTSWRVDLAGDVTIKNLIVSTSVDWGDILAFGHKFVIDENVRTKSVGGVRNLGIRGGGERARCDTPTEIVIKSGEWHGITMGTRQGSCEGNVHLTLYDTAKIHSLCLGNGDASEERPVNGSSTVKLVGKTVNLTATEIVHPIDVMGNVYLDLTEFEEKSKPAAWANVDCIVLTDSTLIPEDALPASMAPTAEEGEGTEGEGTEGEGTEGEGTEGEGAVDEKTEEEKKAEEEAAKKAAEEAAKAEEEAKKALEEAETEEEKAAAEEALKKAEEEKAAAEEAAKKAEEEAKAAEEAKKAAEEEAAKKAEEEAAAKKAQEEAAKKAEEEANKAADATADEGGMSPIIWVVIAVVVVAVIAAVVVVSKKKKA